MFFSKPKKWARAFLQVRRDAPIIRKAEHVVQNVLFSPYLINPTPENVQVMRQSEFEPRSGVSYGVRRSPRFPKTCFPVMKANITVPAQIFNIVLATREHVEVELKQGQHTAQDHLASPFMFKLMKRQGP